MNKLFQKKPSLSFSFTCTHLIVYDQFFLYKYINKATYILFSV